MLNELSWLCQGLSEDAEMSRERLEDINLDTSSTRSDDVRRLQVAAPEENAAKPIILFAACLAGLFIAGSSAESVGEKGT